jgi:hypothetical protein
MNTFDMRTILAAALLAGAALCAAPANAVSARLAQGVCNPYSVENRAMLRFSQWGADNMSQTAGASLVCGGDRTTTGTLAWIGVYDRSPSESVICLLRHLDPNQNTILFSQEKRSSQFGPATSPGIYWLQYDWAPGLDGVPTADCYLPPADPTVGNSHVTSLWFF